MGKAFILALGLLLGASQAASAAVTDGVLGRFVGDWAISGTTRGEPTATSAEVSAGTSRTLGAGQIVGDTLNMTFAYPEGEMRNRLDYDRATDRWRMRIEMGSKDKPALFSDWTFVRKPAR